MTSRTITNFGGNRTFRPESAYAPRDETELLSILHEVHGRRIRVIGKLHSWSEAAVAEDVLIDMRHFQEVRVENRGGHTWVIAGGGCQIKRLLAEMKREATGTLPTLGLVTEQTIAGAISTATHGSGRPSMSNFMEEIRIATYDATTGESVIRVIDAADSLLAARCSLGTMGIIVSVGFWARPQYNVEEFFQQYNDLERVLAKENEFPLQHFFLIPWLWQYIAQHRRETTKPRGGWAALYRLYFFLNFDIGLHLLVRLAVRHVRSPRLVRFLFRNVAPRMVIRNWRVVDDSSRMLIMEHELFQHIECELFVSRSQLSASIEFVIRALKFFDGDHAALGPADSEQLNAVMPDCNLEELSGTYTHHYPICIRRVLPDETLISMTAMSAESQYALSFISYARPNERDGFLAFARMLTIAMAAKFDARPHWGKICPLPAGEIPRLYPGIARFNEVRREVDPFGSFRSEWIDHVLGTVAAQAPTKPPTINTETA